jgi:hypothetical protein
MTPVFLKGPAVSIDLLAIPLRTTAKVVEQALRYERVFSSAWPEKVDYKLES